MNLQNKEKLDNGQSLVQKAYKLTDDVDSTGNKYHIAKSPIGWTGPHVQI